jgi:hypothetical protein
LLFFFIKDALFFAHVDEGLDTFLRVFICPFFRTFELAEQLEGGRQRISDQIKGRSQKPMNGNQRLKDLLGSSERKDS